MYSPIEGCFHPVIAAFLEAGSKLNITWRLGLDVPDRGPVHYSDGVVMYYRFSEYTRLESDLNEGTYLLESTNAFIPLYCSQEHRLEASDASYLRHSTVPPGYALWGVYSSYILLCSPSRMQASRIVLLSRSFDYFCKDAPRSVT